MKRTLLDMTQSILSTIDGDAVTSISDTVESLQIADQIRNTYFDLIDELGLQANKEMRTLQSESNLAHPHVMKLSSDISRIIYFTYNVQQDPEGKLEYKDIVYKTPEDFIRHANSKDSSNLTDNFVWVPRNQPNLKLVISKTAPPSFWTSFDDEYIVFDSYDSNVESTMQSSKTQAYCEIRPVFQMHNDFIPDLPENMFTMLYSTAENRCYYNSKQELNKLGVLNESRIRVKSQRNKYRNELQQNKLSTYPDYGRRRP